MRFSKEYTYNLYVSMHSLVKEMASLAGIEYAEIEEEYFTPIRQIGQKDKSRGCKKFSGKEGKRAVMTQFALSLQNNGHMNGIQFDELNETGNYKLIRKALFDFDSDQILSSYDDGTDLYVKKFKGLDDKVERNHELIRKSKWQEYACGLFDAAKFLEEGSENETALDIINRAISLNEQKFWVDEMKSLPNLIQNKITGLGPALSRDFLKECGCLWLAKPDVHLNAVMKAIDPSLCNVSRKDFAKELSKSVFEFAQAVKSRQIELGLEANSISAFRVDKMIWLICTGRFYRHTYKALDGGAAIPVDGYRALIVKGAQQSSNTD